VILWLVASLSFLSLLALLAWFVPTTLSSSLQIKAEPSGSWGIALGVALGPVSLSALAAAGTRPFVACHLFGRQLARLPLARWLRPKTSKGPPVAAVTAPGRSRASGLERFAAQLLRAVDPVETLLTWWDKDRVQLRSAVLDVEYSFRDVALTGKILAALYVLSGVLPERYVIHQTPAWDSEDRLALAMDGTFRVWLGRLFVDLLAFVLKLLRNLLAGAIGSGSRKGPDHERRK
jgi:tetrahydromethanopterin S-methyltransferase subunit B